MIKDKFFDATMKINSQRVAAASAELAREQLRNLAAIGDAIAEKFSFKDHFGVDAVRYYLMDRYAWPPAMVRAMNIEDLLFAVSEFAFPDKKSPVVSFTDDGREVAAS